MTLYPLADGESAARLFAFRAQAAEFRSAWFMVSLFNEVLILLIMRTRRPFLRSAPSGMLLLTSAVTVRLSVALVYAPASAHELGFVPLPAKLVAAVIAITAGYAFVSEPARLWFFSRARYGGTPSGS